MNLQKQFNLVTSSYFKALSIIFRKGYKRFIALPILINLVLLVFTIWLSFYLGQKISDWTMGQLDFKDEDWTGFLGIIASIVIRVVIFLLYFSVYKYVILILLSPFLSYLSEKVERLEKGTDYEFSLTQLMRDIGRSIVINLRNFLFEIMATVVLSLLAFIPFLGLISPFLILLVQSYFFGFAMLDYNLERRGFSWKSTESWMRKYSVMVTTNGLYFHLSFLIPFVGWIIAPVWGVTAGTLAFLKLEERSGSLRNPTA